MLACIFCIFINQHAFASDDLTLYYYDRPPFYSDDPGGAPTGIFISAAAEIMSRAKITFHWEKLPTKRLFESLYHNSEPACSPGWYSTPERLMNAQLSKPFMTDPPMVAIVDNSKLPEVRPTAAETLNGNFKVLTNGGIVYGKYLDGLFATMPPGRKEAVVGSVVNLLSMIANGRGDIHFLPELEARYLLDDTELKERYHLYDANISKTLRLVHFPDIPLGEARHFVCSKSVSAELMDRLNQAILPPAPMKVQPTNKP